MITELNGKKIAVKGWEWGDEDQQRLVSIFLSLNPLSPLERCPNCGDYALFKRFPKKGYFCDKCGRVDAKAEGKFFWELASAFLKDALQDQKVDLSNDEKFSVLSLYLGLDVKKNLERMQLNLTSISSDSSELQESTGETPTI